ncbi:MAG: flagellar export chaperone FlgN [Demequina sp.]|uniref:flagellar export chaperone FlgN n=1 Tax=Demequina sp. TaxID=2050685 RepID=UPI003A8B6474
MDELSTSLWNERELLETLLFKLEEQELVVAHGRTRWVGRASREVEVVLERMRTAEIGRAMHAEAAATSLGLSADASLKHIAGAAPAPWDDLMHAHHAALSELTAQIAALGVSNHQLLSQALLSTQQALLGVDTDGGTYDTTGAASKAGDKAFLIDEDI